MANYSKFTRSGCANLFAHFDRTLSNNANQNIDSSRSYLNYNLAPSGNQSEILSARLAQVKVLKRKDVNVLSSWVVTLPKDFTGDEKSFFKASYDFLATKYGKQNIVSAYVHKDEVQPHMHFAFVPVVKDKKKGVEKVSAKECVTLFDLQVFHQELQKNLETALGQEVHILNGATKDGNLSTRELKLQKKEKVFAKEKADFDLSKAAVAEFLKTIDENIKPLPELDVVTNIGTPKKLEESFPVKKTGTFSKESAYEYGNRMSKIVWNHIKKKFYDPLKNKCNKLLETVKTLSQELNQKNARIDMLERQNKALNQSVDKVVEARLKSRSGAILERVKAEAKARSRMALELDDLKSLTAYGVAELAKTMQNRHFKTVSEAVKYQHQNRLESITDIKNIKNTNKFNFNIEH